MPAGPREPAPLLRGGEVLLTTGLALIGVDGVGLRRYAERIADRQVAAVGLELGRTFPAVPDALFDACADRELGLFALHTIVPFVDIAREANERILDHEAIRLRRVHEVSATLTDALLSGHSLGQLLTRIAEPPARPRGWSAPRGGSSRHRPAATRSRRPCHDAPRRCRPSVGSGASSSSRLTIARNSACCWNVRRWWCSWRCCGPAT
ncbi:hypothetical protein BH23ACT10_BH23ACT10_33040 [soil metagenome]